MADSRSPSRSPSPAGRSPSPSPPSRSPSPPSRSPSPPSRSPSPSPAAATKAANGKTAAAAADAEAKGKAKGKFGGYSDFAYLYNGDFDPDLGFFKDDDNKTHVPIKFDDMPASIKAPLCQWLAAQNEKLGLDKGPDRSERFKNGTANFHDFHSFFEDLHVAIYKAYVVCRNNNETGDAAPGTLIKKYFGGKKFNVFIPQPLRDFVAARKHKEWPVPLPAADSDETVSDDSGEESGGKQRGGKPGKRGKRGRSDDDDEQRPAAKRRPGFQLVGGSDSESSE